MKRTFLPGGPVRVRFAPSPTGFLHLGGLRTALFNFLIARQRPDSRFILRIEDTDQSRSVPGAIEQLIQTLQWCGLSFDEGPGRESGHRPSHGPYIQSQRLHLYHKRIEELIDRGQAYRCFCSKERLEGLKTLLPWGRYDRLCRSLPPEEVKARLRDRDSSVHTSVVRFKAPDSMANAAAVHDLVHGPISLPINKIDDAVLLKSDGFPTYHFANIVDDRLMDVNLVIRGQEWIASTPLHALLYSAFEWTAPTFAHLPLLVNADGSKLSKRQDDAHVAHYMAQGYLPEALLNFVAFLGWAPSKQLESEVMDLEGLARNFRLEELNSSDATVNMAKLDWLNRKHLQRRLSSGNGDVPLIQQLRNAANKLQSPSIFRDMNSIPADYLKHVLQLMAERVTFPGNVVDLAPYFFADPSYESDEAKDMLAHTLARWGQEAVTSHLKALSASDGLNDTIPGMLLRLTLTARKIGPSVKEIAAILPRDTVSRRAQRLLAYVAS